MPGESGDPIAGRYESFRFAAALCPSRSRLQQIFLSGLAPVACPPTMEFRGLCPFDLGIRGGHRSVEVATIKCGIRGTMFEAASYKFSAYAYNSELPYRTLCWLPNLVCYRLLLMSQKNPETESVRNQQ